jgi:uncharacterized protein YjiS (DUF1127 family)
LTSITARSLGAGEISAGCGGALRRLAKDFSAWRCRRRQRAELYALSDTALKDFGIFRGEIEGIVSSPNRDTSGRVRWGGSAGGGGCHELV